LALLFAAQEEQVHLKWMRSGLAIALLMSFLGVTTLSTRAQTSEDQDLETALRLASLLREARAVIGSYQDVINDPKGGDKGLTGDFVLDIARERYIEVNSVPPLYDGQDSREADLIAAQMTAIREVMADNQTTINSEGIAFKGFVPAVFGRLVNERFYQLVGDQAVVKVTAPPRLVRNRKARPDAWETGIITDRLMSEDWPKDDIFAAEAPFDDQPAFRVLVPEYYSEGCIACHGGPKGEIDVTGYPKEGGKVGDLGGVISISLMR
jgi:hypothetical protein